MCSGYVNQHDYLISKDRLIDSAMAEGLPLARPQSPHVQPSDDASSSAHAVSSRVPVPGSPSARLSSLRLEVVCPMSAWLLVVADGIELPLLFGSFSLQPVHLSTLPLCCGNRVPCSRLHHV